MEFLNFKSKGTLYTVDLYSIGYTQYILGTCIGNCVYVTCISNWVYTEYSGYTIAYTCIGHLAAACTV